MEISFNEITDLKKRFGDLLSFLYYSANIQLENISSKLIESSFLDILEDNRIDEFLSLSNIECLNILFPKAQVKNITNKTDIGEIYWCGIQYMNIFLNYRIPLRQIILFCPLSEMVKKYEIYHEMNEIELCRFFINNEYNKISTIKYFRKLKNISFRQLSYLTSIPEPTLKYFETDNEKIFAASNNTVAILQKTLSIDKTFVKKRSDFLPITYRLLTNKEFVVFLSKVIGNYFLHSFAPDIKIRFFKEENEQKGESYLFINGEPFLSINGQIIPINDDILKNIISKSIDEYLQKYLKTNLVF